MREDPSFPSRPRWQREANKKRVENLGLTSKSNWPRTTFKNGTVVVLVRTVVVLCSFELFSVISSHSAVFFFHNKPANNTHPAVFFSYNKPANSTFSHNKPAKRTNCRNGAAGRPPHVAVNAKASTTAPARRSLQPPPSCAVHR
jgi:hypothetical protein